MELPPQPVDSEFDSWVSYGSALRAWERVCLAIIEAQLPRQPEPLSGTDPGAEGLIDLPRFW